MTQTISRDKESLIELDLNLEKSKKGINKMQRRTNERKEERQGERNGGEEIKDNGMTTAYNNHQR